MADIGVGRRREALLIGAASLAAVVLLVRWATPRPKPQGPRRVAASPGLPYVGSRSCGECHPGISAAHHASGHARTFRPAGKHPLAHWLNGRSLPDPDRPDVTWAFALRGDELTVERAEGGQTERQVLEYALGSGRHATTFITRLETDPENVRIREHRLTYFAHADALGITPGQNAPYPGASAHASGRDFPTELSLKCVECHVTRTSSAGSGRFDPATAIPNVGCERCHGPAGAHVKAAQRGATELAMPFGPARWTAAEQMRLCGACHRHPDVIPPGVLRPGNPALARFQPVGLMQSACYTKGDGALSCATCHDPHSKTSRDQAGYESTCRSCHGGDSPRQPACSVSSQGGCLGCHMPQVETTRGMRFTDHWIRVLDRSAASEAEPRPVRVGDPTPPTPVSTDDPGEAPEPP